ncbi:MAG: NAD(P)/FAD-dependent oxidoreductase [Rhodospirillales bacterium]|nr:NAD(P)/FAD-dependent oxidoreductase [Rhodospirillales bacterium]
MSVAVEQTDTAPAIDFEILIVGSGFSGIGAAIKLQEMGFNDFVILEKADDLGGTWRDNTYPGLTVDILSFLYSYSYEPNPDWSRLYAPGAELKKYADHCAEKYGVRQRIKFGKAVKKTVYDGDHNVWVTHLENGEVYVSRYFVSACGVLTLPKMPDIEGVNDFKGKVIHTAKWDHGHDLTGESVAVIGTGATAIQMIPEIIDKVKSLDVYQRTPIWLLPKMDGNIAGWLKKAFRIFPPLQKVARAFANLTTELILGVGFVHHKQIPFLFNWAERQGTKLIRAQVNDPALQDKLIPDYSFFCKRPSFSNVYFPVFNRDNVELVTNPIQRITETGVVTQDGQARDVDTLICATGFQVFSRGSMPTFEVFGKNGLNLGEFWEKNRFQAYEGASVPEFPNYFMILGPYAVASASYFGMIDTQVRHLIRCLKRARKQGANYIEVKQEAHDRNFEKVIGKRENLVLYNGSCATANSYYFDKNGDAPLLRPVTNLSMWWTSHTFNLDDYRYDTK